MSESITYCAGEFVSGCLAHKQISEAVLVDGMYVINLVPCLEPPGHDGEHRFGDEKENAA